MLIVTSKNNVIKVEQTKNGGRKMTMVSTEKPYKIYTHPSRSNSMKRFVFDIEKLENLASK